MGRVPISLVEGSSTYQLSRLVDYLLVKSKIGFHYDLINDICRLDVSPEAGAGILNGLLKDYRLNDNIARYSFLKFNSVICEKVDLFRDLNERKFPWKRGFRQKKISFFRECKN